MNDQKSILAAIKRLCDCLLAQIQIVIDIQIDQTFKPQSDSMQ